MEADGDHSVRFVAIPAVMPVVRDAPDTKTTLALILCSRELICVRKLHFQPSRRHTEGTMEEGGRVGSLGITTERESAERMAVPLGKKAFSRGINDAIPPSSAQRCEYTIHRVGTF